MYVLKIIYIYLICIFKSNYSLRKFSPSPISKSISEHQILILWGTNSDTIIIEKSWENIWIKKIPTGKDLKLSSMQAYKIFHAQKKWKLRKNCTRLRSAGPARPRERPAPGPVHGAAAGKPHRPGHGDLRPGLHRHHVNSRTASFLGKEFGGVGWWSNFK